MTEPPEFATSLFLVPTQLELNHIADRLPESCTPHVCGFGPVAPGIKTTRWLAEGSFKRVILLGIAGTYNSKLFPVGSAGSFQRVGCYGIGAGEAENFQTAKDIGLEASDELPLVAITDDAHDMLLTVCSAASDAIEVERRRAKFPAAVAEDMEAFSVAMAAGNFGMPTTVIRGVSNVAGDRNHSTWQIKEAMKAALKLLDTADW